MKRRPGRIWEIRDMPHNQNRTEYKLFEAMKKVGLNPKPQHLISKMHVDFAFPDQKLVIEVNGPYHLETSQMITDMGRTHILKKMGWNVIYIPAKSAYYYPYNCVEHVQEELKGLGLDVEFLEEKSNKFKSWIKGLFEKIKIEAS